MARMIPLTRGFRAVVDDDDYEWLCKWKWHVMPNGRGFYACRRQKMSETGLPKHLTRIVWMHKQIDPNCKDHRDRNGLNNQRENLRPASKSQNAANAEKHSDNSTGFKGVHKCRGRWKAAICCLGKRQHLGVFLSRYDAALAYDAAARRLFGEFARTNF